MVRKSLFAVSTAMCCGLAIAPAFAEAPSSVLSSRELKTLSGGQQGARTMSLSQHGVRTAPAQQGGQMGIQATCPPGSVQEGEGSCFDFYEDTFNAGCNADIPVFSSISCGQTVCGETGIFVSGFEGGEPVESRDTDWYEFTIGASACNLSRVTFTVDADVQLQLAVIDPGASCDEIAVVNAAIIEPGTPTVVEMIVPAGDWYMFASATFDSGAFCGAADYVISMECEAFCPPPPPPATDLGEIAQPNTIFGIALCGSAMDSEMGLWNEFGELIGFDDDGCGSTGGPSQIFVGVPDEGDLFLYPDVLPAGRYYFSVSGWETVFGPDFSAVTGPQLSTGSYSGVAGSASFSGTITAGEVDWYTFEVSSTASGCEFNAPAGATPEGEPICEDLYDDTYNSGCLGDVPAFTPIAAGQTIAATAGTYVGENNGAFRDTDWYSFTVTETSDVTITGEGELPLVFGILDDDCNNLVFIESTVTVPCPPIPGEVKTRVEPGTYYIFAAPADFVGIECGSEYAITLEVEEAGECNIVCPPGSDQSIEPPLADFEDDTINPGCLGDVFAAETMSVGETVCGTAGVYLNRQDGQIFQFRDFDWWNFNLTEETEVTLTINAAFPALAGFTAASSQAECNGWGFVAADVTENPCEELVITATLAPGSWAVVLTTNDWPNFASDSPYTITLSTGEEPTCPADFDDNGVVNVQDLIGFLQAFGTQAPSADVDGNPGVAVGDLIFFLQAFGAGC